MIQTGKGGKPQFQQPCENQSDKRQLLRLPFYLRVLNACWKRAFQAGIEEPVAV